MTTDGSTNDDELRIFWKVATDAGTYGAFLQICLLTAQRRIKVVEMKRSQLTSTGVWVIDGDIR
ncbi:MAG: hypothetical protein KUG65_03575, partial [Sphingomonadaceae bacterium]|nr:hypothetical protein [Sphingomonadaceae bacterium]